jgi:hypothetical protein
MTYEFNGEEYNKASAHQRLWGSGTFRRINVFARKYD